MEKYLNLYDKKENKLIAKINLFIGVKINGRKRNRKKSIRII